MLIVVVVGFQPYEVHVPSQVAGELGVLEPRPSERLEDVRRVGHQQRCQRRGIVGPLITSKSAGLDDVGVVVRQRTIRADGGDPPRAHDRHLL